MNDAVGTTKSVTGGITVQPDGTIVSDTSKITVDLQSLQTDNGMRDNYVKRNTLQTDKYPNAEFLPRSTEGLPNPLPTSGEVKFQLHGDLTVHGVTKPVTWDVTAQVAGKDLRGKATTAVKFGGFDLAQPRVARVRSIQDNIRLELDFHLTGES
ncbi:MAG: YceI family protein [Chloroflexi bacterium]|nr:YceI family protein [Chloroflexota bacterium]